MGGHGRKPVGGPAPETPEGLLARLDALGIETRTVRHPPVFTVAESRALRGALPGGHSKNLFLRPAKGDGPFLLAVLEEDRKISVNTLARAAGAAGWVEMAPAEALRAALGVEPGSVTPLAIVNDAAGRVTHVIDAGLLAHEVVNCHTLRNDATTAIRRDDLLRFVRAAGHEPVVVDLGKA